jgi:ubiquinone/menaquinone biosynthesis C-methylase UbiE
MEDDKVLELQSYEKWWTNNLGKETYEHEGVKVACPSIETFDTWMGDKNSPDRAIVRNVLGEFNSILDAGCGGCPEYYGIMEIDKTIKYTGVDITPSLVEYNRQRGIDCHHGSLNKLPFDDNQFDVVQSRHVVEHMNNIEAPLQEMIRVATDKVVVSFFIDPLENKTDSHHISLDDKNTEYEVYHNRYSRLLIENLLKNNDKVKNAEWRRPVAATTKSLLLIQLKDKDL